MFLHLPKRLLLAGALAGAALTAEAQTFETVLSSNLFNPSSVAVSPLNRYVISDTANHRIVEFNPDNRGFVVIGGEETSPSTPGAVDGQGFDARFRNPQGLIYVGDRLIVADTGNNLIREIDANGVVTTIAGDVELAAQADEIGGTPQNAGFVDGPALAARFRSPSGLAYNEDGNIVYIADPGNRAVRALDLDDYTVSTVVSSGLHTPLGVAWGLDNRLYIADAGHHAVKTWQPGETSPRLLAGSGNIFDRGFKNSSVATNALFSSPSGVMFHRSFDADQKMKEEVIVVDTGNSVLRSILNPTSANPSVGTFANTGAADYQSPLGIARDMYGMFLVTDSARNSLNSIVTVRAPRIEKPRIGYIVITSDPVTDVPIATLRDVTEQEFDNEVIIAFSGDPKGVHHYEALSGLDNPSDTSIVPLPTTASRSHPNFVDPTAPPPPLYSAIAANRVIKIKAYTAPGERDNRVASPITEATFIFRTAMPVLDTLAKPGSVVFRCATLNADIWYTTDGSEPDAATANGRRAKAGDSLPLVVEDEKLVIRARAYKSQFLASYETKREFLQTDSVNRISFGFAGGEASSKFIGAPGQRFFAPVTLSLLPGSQAYGLQFNLSITNNGSSPAADFQLGFVSSLIEYNEGSTNYVIPPRMFAGFTNELEPLFTNESGVVFFDTNQVPVFTNLVFTNSSLNLLGVGWVERFGQTNLFNTKKQHLLAYSQPHDTIFESVDGQAVPGSFAFTVPVVANTSDTYTLRVDRPSATGDGIQDDLYIQAPAEDNPDYGIKAAVQVLRLGHPKYIVGDLVPFTWFNAGEFGDTNILNNDITQILQAAVYNLNVPPLGSDFYDAMDTCCFTADGIDLSDIRFADGAETNINRIAYGDQSRPDMVNEVTNHIQINDLFVAFRRALDPSLVWYERYWSNGVRNARIIDNSFRGQTAPPPLARQSIALITPLENDPVIRTAEAPGFKLSVGSATGVAGQMVELPVTLDVSGGYPVRTLMFNVTIERLQGLAFAARNLEFIPTDALGTPTSVFSDTPGRIGLLWLDANVNGVLGQKVIGHIRFQIPDDASVESLFLARLDRVSASPNGITLLPANSGNGVISHVNRPASEIWSDGISDPWRIQHFGTVFSNESHASLDPDVDGLSNFEEFQAGTSPVDNADNLKVRVHVGTDRLPKVRFRTQAGKTYRVEASQSLSRGSWTTIQSNVAGTGNDLEISGTPDESHIYYRVRLQD